MTLLLEKPTIDQEIPEDFDGEYLYILGFAIVDRASFDCWVCAWKHGFSRWKNCRMALVRQFDSTRIRARCRELPGVQEHIFFIGKNIEGSVFADCAPCALRKGLPSWPGTNLAMVVPCNPQDVSLECRIELKKRNRGDQ
jgi:hypothetical protein